MSQAGEKPSPKTALELLQLLVKTGAARNLSELRFGFVQTMACILKARCVHLMGVDATLKSLAPLAEWPQRGVDLPSFALEGKAEVTQVMLWALKTPHFQIESPLKEAKNQGDFLLKTLKNFIFSEMSPQVTSKLRFALIPVTTEKEETRQENIANLIFFALIEEQDISPETILLSETYARYCDMINNNFLELERQKSAANNLSRSLILADKDRDRMKAALPAMLSSRLVGRSKRMQNLRENIARFAPSDLPIFIHGETGTGKELVAREIHRLSSRQCQDFVAINVTALPKGLEESELFGFVKGAFTGAERNRKGYFAQAAGGTLFFDEIGDMPLDLQAKILRVLQEKTFRPLGSNEEISSNFRLISATHRNIEEMVRAGTFREDLYYRLTTFTVSVPSLAARREDINDIGDYFLAQIAEQHHINAKKLSPKARKFLSDLPLPGNIRQLQALLLRALYLSDDSLVIEEHHLIEAQGGDGGLNRHHMSNSLHALNLSGMKGLKMALEIYERDILLQAYRQHDGQRTKMAQQLKIPLRTLADKIKKYDLEGKKHESAQHSSSLYPHHSGVEHGMVS